MSEEKMSVVRARHALKVEHDIHSSDDWQNYLVLVPQSTEEEFNNGSKVANLEFYHDNVANQRDDSPIAANPQVNTGLHGTGDNVTGVPRQVLEAIKEHGDSFNVPGTTTKAYQIIGRRQKSENFPGRLEKYPRPENIGLPFFRGMYPDLEALSIEGEHALDPISHSGEEYGKQYLKDFNDLTNNQRKYVKEAQNVVDHAVYTAKPNVLQGAWAELDEDKKQKDNDGLEF